MKLKEQYCIQQVADSYMAMAMSNEGGAQNRVIRLNKTSKDIFDMLKEDITEDEIVQRMMQLYEVEESVVRKGVQQLVAQLQANHMLQ